MDILYERIEALCNLSNMKPSNLESELGFSDSSLIKWKTGNAWASRVLKVAQYFDVSVDYLLGNTDNPSSHKLEPRYDTIGTTLDLQQIKGEIEAQAAALASLVDEKIAKANALGQAPASEPENKSDGPH